MHKSKNLRNDSSDQIKRQNKKIKNIKIAFSDLFF